MKYLLSLIILCVSVSFGFSQTVVSVDTDNSTITWTGKKVTGKHTGTIDISDGKLIFEEGYLTGGSFTIDMTTIANEDLGDKMKGRLEGHLKSDDFFGVDAHPTADLVITNVAKSGSKYDITADLTIKGVTAPVSFTAEMADGGAQANISVDRTLYNVKYGSGKFFQNLGDKMIDDHFNLDVKLAIAQ